MTRGSFCTRSMSPSARTRPSLNVRDVDVFVATFVTMYSGLIPMFSTAGNTTNDGLVGALLNDRFAKNVEIPESSSLSVPVLQGKGLEARGMRLWLGWALLLSGAWMLVAPQAKLGLKQLQWMNHGSFRGEVLLGVLVIGTALYLLSVRYSMATRPGVRA